MAGLTRRSVIAGLVAMPAVARAQSWPSGAITLVVPYPAGGSNDQIVRLIQPSLQKQLGVNVIVENRGGGGTTIGAAMVAKGPRDGSRWLINSDPQILNPSLIKSMPYDPADLEPLLMIGTAPNVVAVHPSTPWKTLDDVLKDAKANSVNVAVIGDTLAHISMIMLGQKTGAKITPVPYRGGAPAMNDVLGQHVPMIAGSAGLLGANIQSGALRAIVQTGTTRMSVFKDVPTVLESGVPEFAAETSWGFYAPSKTPQPILDRFSAALATSLQEETTATRLRDTMLIQPNRLQGEAFRRFFDSETKKWGDVIRAAGLQRD